MLLNDMTCGINMILSAAQLSSAITSFVMSLRAARCHTYINNFCKDGFFMLFSLEKQLLRCWNSQFRE